MSILTIEYFVNSDEREVVTRFQQAYRDAVKSGFVNKSLIRKHVERYARIDSLLPEGGAFFYVLEIKAQRYRFMGRQQAHVSGYDNEKMMRGGVAFFMDCLHPDDKEILLEHVYPAFTDAMESVPEEERTRLQVQYNYRFRRKDGEYLNLFEQDYVLELDNKGVPSLVLGNVNVLNDKRPLPVRFACNRISDSGMSETFYFKSFNRNTRSLDSITPREVDVLRLLAEGRTSREIAKELFISRHTVDTHRRNLLKKLGCKTVVDLVQIAYANGLCSTDG